MDIKIGEKYIYVLSNEIDSYADKNLVGHSCTVTGRHPSADHEKHLGYNVVFDGGDRYFLYDAELMSLKTFNNLAKSVEKINIIM